MNGSGTGRAPATDEAATERAELPDHDANEASRSMPKPADAGGKAVTTRRRAGRCSAKARAKRRGQQHERTPETAPATAEKTTKYLIEPNTAATPDFSHAKLMSFLKEIGVTDEIERIAIANMARTSTRRDGRGNCVGFGADTMPLTTDDDEHLLPITDWQDVEIEITLDSGCCEHVLDVAEVPGYTVSESPGSRR